MDDLVKSFKAYLYDRVSSPLLSSFLVSWALWNHRLFVVLISSDLKIKEKFAYTDEVLYPTIHEVGLRGFLWPLLSALALLFVYPIPSRWVFEYVRNEQKRLKGIQQRIEDETPVTQEEARGLRAIIREAAHTLDKEINDRDAEIKSLQAEVDALQSQIMTSRPQETAPTSPPVEVQENIDASDYSRSPLSHSERQILHAIADNDGLSEQGLRAAFKKRENLSPLQVKYFLDELLKKRLIEIVNTMDEGTLYVSTPEGRSNIMNVHVTIGEK